MTIKNIIKLALLGLSILTQLHATSNSVEDINIKDYIDRGIHYYPRYVNKGLVKYGKASWYGKPFHGRITANGERYNMYSMTAAHRTYAMGTIVKVTNLKNHKSIQVRINDRGPFYHTRDIDLSYAAAKKLGMDKKGVEKIKLEVIKASKKPKGKVIPRHEKIQVASFYDQKLAYSFRKKYKLKNSIIIKKYIKEERRTAYRVIVKCTPWEAKRLLKSQKFAGAYKV
jgi:rare lipoprotein A